MIFHTSQKIREHLFFDGIDQSYHTWYWHGEAAPSGHQLVGQNVMIRFNLMMWIVQ